MRPFQIIFTPTGAAELSKMPKELQLQILGEFRGLPQEVISTELERFGKLERDGHVLHRFRVGDYRIYFERAAEGITVHRVLHRNTIRDFLFRAALPMPAEDGELARERRFWELIEAGREARKR